MKKKHRAGWWYYATEGISFLGFQTDINYAKSAIADVRAFQKGRCT